VGIVKHGKEKNEEEDEELERELNRGNAVLCNWNKTGV
jgi:hypothetical protein